MLGDIEITTGFLMFWGGIALAGGSVLFALIYLAASGRKAKALLKKLDKEDI